MVNWHIAVCRIVIPCLMILFTPPQLLFAKGDTVLLTFQKTAVSKRETRDYVVKKGEWTVSIIRRQLGAKGRDAFKVLRLVKQLNPHIRNLNRIYQGQVIKLPTSMVSTTSQVPTTNQETEFSEAKIPATKEKHTREKPAVPLENCLAIIRYVINRMNGTIMTTGNCYIPIFQIGQTTIDCSKIPVIELDDGSVILFDFSNRMPEYLSKMIRANWKNYHLVKTTNNDDIAHILQRIINTSSLYTMNKGLQPFLAGENPQVRLSLDWMITKSTPPGTKPYLQGISLVPEKSHLLPESLITYTEKKGLIITEIMDGSSVINTPPVTYTIPEIPIIGKTANREMVYNLLITLSYQPLRDANVKIFDTAKAGFGLSLKADLMVKNGDKEIVIHAEKLPQQFINILRDRGTEVTFIEEGESRRSAIAKTLHVMNIPFSYHDFSFSIPENTDKARVTITFPATKITTKDKGDLYLIDFDMDREIYGLLHDKWGVNFIRY